MLQNKYAVQLEAPMNLDYAQLTDKIFMVKTLDCNCICRESRINKRILQNNSFILVHSSGSDPYLQEAWVGSDQEIDE